MIVSPIDIRRKKSSTILPFTKSNFTFSLAFGGLCRLIASRVETFIESARCRASVSSGTFFGHFYCIGIQRKLNQLGVTVHCKSTMTTHITAFEFVCSVDKNNH